MSQVSLPVGTNFLLQAVPLFVSDSVAQGTCSSPVYGPFYVVLVATFMHPGSAQRVPTPGRWGHPILDVGRYIGARASDTERPYNPMSWPSSWVIAGG